MTQFVAGSGEIILPPVDREHTQFPTDYGGEDNPLPDDGFPRITSEGVKILIEGIRGDFSRWCWGIGNHPIELPARCVRNLTVRCMKDELHFIARFYYGTHYPQTTKYQNLAPDFVFDKVDDMMGYTDRTSIRLLQSADYWAGVSVLIDNLGKCAT